tara:strand:- start:774 stop:1079 length:306 start_codon:yes stop_codon:yes gene_type:complete
MSRIIPYLVDSLRKREAGNINLSNREKIPVDGGYATVRSMSFNEDGKEVLVPTAADGKILSDQQAVDRYHTTGQHLGKFATPHQATRYGESLHQQQAKQYE